MITLEITVQANIASAMLCRSAPMMVSDEEGADPALQDALSG